MDQPNQLKSEDGTTLIETLIAMAILVSVLLPTSLFLGYIANNPKNEQKIIAMSLAQSEMESILSAENFSSYEKVTEDNWVIKCVPVSRDNLVQINVSVFGKNKQKPIITFSTERLVYEAKVKK